MPLLGADYGRCFGCGAENPLGLRLDFEVEGMLSRCKATLTSDFQGWSGSAHGGIVMLLLDEAMAHSTRELGWIGVTAECSVRFRKPVPLNALLCLQGKVTWHRRNVAGVSAEIRDADDNLLATSTGSFVRIRSQD